MTRILITQTASPSRVRARAEDILKGSTCPAPSITLLCRPDPETVEYLGKIPGAKVVPLRAAGRRRILREMRHRDFDQMVTFWTGERGYWREKIAACRLCKNTIVDMGDGGQWPLTWRFVIRYWLFRLRHPRPTDHALYVPHKEASKASYHDGERILIIQSAEPAFVLRALDRLGQEPLFRNPQFSIFCRNDPETVARFQNHPMIKAIRTHSEAAGAWRHLHDLRRMRLDAVVVFFTGNPSYWKIKLFAFLLGSRHVLVFNENCDCYFWSWKNLLPLLVQRAGEQSRTGLETRWKSELRALLLYLTKLVIFPFRLAWLLVVWVRLRSKGQTVN